MSDHERRYYHLIGLAHGAEIRTATFEGAEHMVVPVVAMVGDSVVRPLYSDAPELVPAIELAKVPSGWNGRPVLPTHPPQGQGANQPHVLEKMAFGLLFNTRFDDNRLKTEAWLDPNRAEQAGAEAVQAIEDLRAGETIEVSVGAYVIAEQSPGTLNGRSYERIWRDIVPDHLAVGLGDKEGACNVDMGCGGPRVNEGTALKRHRGERAELRTLVRSSARRPTFSGTETASWSAPSFEDYVGALFDGDDPPTTVDAASASLRGRIAAHTLLGDPAAEDFRNLSFFPVVNPRNGSLNEGALRAVIGGRGSQANIPAEARDSAQNMARRLLNSQFDAELEVSMSFWSKTKPVEAWRRALEALGLREAQEPEGRSVNEIGQALYEALRAVVPEFEGIGDIFLENDVVIYITTPANEPARWWRRSFTVDDEGVVELADDAEQIEPVTKYEPVAAQGGCDCSDDVGTGEGHAARAHKKGEAMSDKLKELVGRLIANERTPFKKDEHEESLAALGQEALECVERRYAEEATPPPDDTEEQTETETETETEVQPQPEGVLLSKEEYGAMKAASDAHHSRQAEKKTRLVEAVGKATDAYTADQLEAKSIDDLESLAKALKVGQATPNYEGQGLPESPTSDDSPPPPPNFVETIKANRASA